MWATMDIRRTFERKVPVANILRQRNGIGRAAVGVQTVKETSQLLITQEMVLLLAKENNRRAHSIMEQWNKQNPSKEK